MGIGCRKALNARARAQQSSVADDEKSYSLRLDATATMVSYVGIWFVRTMQSVHNKYDDQR